MLTQVGTWKKSVLPPGETVLENFIHGKLRSLPRRQRPSTDGRKIMKSYTMELVSECFDRALMDENLPENLSEWLDNAACDDDIPNWVWNLVWALEKYQQYIDEE